MIVALACDHAGFYYKESIRKALLERGVSVQDFGAHSEEPVDYPDIVRPAAEAVARNDCQRGIIVGGSGNEAIVANRIRGIRCAVVWNLRTAELSMAHGNCNMIAIGQRMMTETDALAIVDHWLAATFAGGRHQRRIDKIDV
ncbi:RpiB/LacA/LacB family sugar-phosphate isomerase [Reinekea blandensis]|uniref:Ribose 5-phosphate isomerase B n=1 Tax=Reinekea blandensis MED297 TaxID=314283 RepID=A4BFY6_9GAMM|nr:RpiB/LacA/LacB family sugar-phosphate isomerase [Reinekea blandensis]EAR09004.1 ribose 5-phosphate isomerase B [Reinekea sp. MED297] [Reinekea blandensis MED297]